MEAGSAPARAWKAAECSLSTGSSSAPERATAAVKTCPAETRHSLLASATRAPCEAAANVGRSPAAPTIAAMTQSAGSSAASTSAAAPPAVLMPVPAKRFPELAQAGFIADHRELGVVAAGEVRRVPGRSIAPSARRSRSGPGCGRRDRACSFRSSLSRRGSVRRIGRDASAGAGRALEPRSGDR